MCDDTTTRKPAPRTFCSVCKLREGIYVDSVGVECCSHAALGECSALRWDTAIGGDVMDSRFVDLVEFAKSTAAPTHRVLYADDGSWRLARPLGCESLAPRRPTYRERREARADRLRGWADKRDAKAAGAFATADSIAERFPFGQPILVGHHSEARARRDQGRIVPTMRRGIEHNAKAEAMRQRADNIERAAARAIYSDDPDAADALGAKIATLEAKRDRYKAYNASCRAAARLDPESKTGDLSLLDDAQRADLLNLARVCPYQLDKNGQFPSYATTNLGATINAARKRLERLEA